jgi:hypothetical protein
LERDQRSGLHTAQEELRSKLRRKLGDGYETWSAADAARVERWRAGQDPGMNGEDYSDLDGLISGTEGQGSSGGVNVDGEEDRLRWEVTSKRNKREELLARLVTAQTEVSSRP